MTSILSFERKMHRKEDGGTSKSKYYIDFLIDKISLKNILGDVNSNIGKFGWRGNLNFEMQELNELLNLDKSRHDNGLFSVYVCAECGDEGCLAVMFEKQTTQNQVIWSNFVWSDGYDEIDDSHVKFDLEPIIFEIDSYKKSLKELEKLIKY